MSKFSQSGLNGIIIGKGICYACNELWESGDTCNAFPEQIPADILTGKIDHRKPVAGDNGIRFKQR